jgi:NAD(P)-dependent dehydrogenase (short-subunit alcohol dehydrogenase family)
MSDSNGSSNLRREVVAITGASGGVGRAIAQEFARHGAAVGLIARGAAGLAAAATEVKRLGGDAFASQADVADYEAVSRAADAVEQRFGPIDVWVNNAMTTVFAYFEDVEPAEFERATRVTYLGTVWGTRTALERMLPRDRGTIVQVGSALAYQGIPLQSAYCGSKHAIKGLQESLRCELRSRGSNVHATMVQLPGMNTPQFDHCLNRMPHHPQPVKPIFQPEVAARAVYWAAHHRRREIYVGLPTVYTILGSKFAPWLAERYLAKTAISGQQTEEAAERYRPANLFTAVDEDHDEGAHGSFDSEAHGHSPQAWLARHRLSSGLGAAAAFGAAVGMTLARGASQNGHR